MENLPLRPTKINTGKTGLFFRISLGGVTAQVKRGWKAGGVL
jgi:hypothetical protein